MSENTKNNDVIIADNQYLITEALKAILHHDFLIKDVVTCKYDLMNSLQSGCPKFLIIDYSSFDFNGFNDLREIKKLYPLLVIIILTNIIGKNDLNEFNNLGIKIVLHKNSDEDEIQSGIAAAIKGKKFYSDIILELMLEINEKKGIIEETSQLTNSETEIVRLIAQGLTTKEIAGRKFISFHTVMTHRKNILRKLGVSNASELIMYAIRNGIIDTIEYHI